MSESERDDLLSCDLSSDRRDSSEQDTEMPPPAKLEKVVKYTTGVPLAFYACALDFPTHSSNKKCAHHGHVQQDHTYRHVK